MDSAQIKYFQQRYQSMGDEELAVLVATRWDHLSEEARAALSEVLRGKNLPDFIREVNATVDDLTAQARAAGAELKRQQEHRRRARKAMGILLGVVVLIGVLMAVLQSR